MKIKTKALTGAEAAAEAMKQINPDVVPAYPITPQTPIMEKFCDFAADGDVDTEIIRVESEHSAMSAAVGASAAGARVMTATCSAGLALMFEIVGCASGLRLPIVMNIVNRALSAPINIHCDHSDAMACRDTGWIQIYCENAQEVYENTVLAMRLAEKVSLPAMVCQDGFILSHGVENVDVLEDNKVKKFVGDFKPKNSLLDVDNPATFGPLQLTDYYFETQKQRADAMLESKKDYLSAGRELSKITKSDYGYFEAYNLDKAEHAIICLGSTAGTTKAVVDRLKNERVGLLKIKLFRPFPYKEVSEVIKNLKSIAVLDRSESFGALPPLFKEIRNSLFDADKKPNLQSYVYGLGGRDIFEKEIENVFGNLLKNKITNKVEYIGVR